MSRWLNVGCDGAYRPGYVNLDFRADVPADVVADACLLPFDESSFERVELIHVLEHLSYSRALAALAEARRVLVSDGILVVETPSPERSFRAFLDDEDQQHRAGLLSWIFGLPRPGYAHQILFPEALLRAMLVRAGFEGVTFEEPRFHRYAPGQRVVARRGGAAIHDVVGELRQRLAQDNPVDLSEPRVALAFEREVISALLQFGEAPLGDGVEALPADVLLRAIQASPRAARIWLDAVKAHGIGEPAEVDQYLLLARSADEDRLTERLIAQALGVQSLEERPSEAPERPFFPPVVEDIVLCWHNEAIRLFATGRPDEAEALLLRAAKGEVLTLYPLWNLAIMRAARADSEAAVAFYDRAMKVAPAELVPTLSDEREVARQGDLAKVRTHPVLIGEGIWHAPEGS